MTGAGGGVLRELGGDGAFPGGPMVRHGRGAIRVHADALPQRGRCRGGRPRHLQGACDSATIFWVTLKTDAATMMGKHGPSFVLPFGEWLEQIRCLGRI